MYQGRRQITCFKKLMTITMSFSGIGFGFLNYNFILRLVKLLVCEIFKNHCFTVSMRSLLIMRYLLDQKQLISANIWPYNKWNDSKKNCKTIIELYIAFRKIIENDSNITLCMEYVLVSIKCQPHNFLWLLVQTLNISFL